MWKGPRKYHENAQITHAFLRMISADTVKKFYAAALRDTLQRYADVQFTVINS